MSRSNFRHRRPARIDPFGRRLPSKTWTVPLLDRFEDFLPPEEWATDFDYETSVTIDREFETLDGGSAAWSTFHESLRIDGRLVVRRSVGASE